MKFSLKQVIVIVLGIIGITFSAGMTYKTFLDYGVRMAALEGSNKALWRAIGGLNK